MMENVQNLVETKWTARAESYCHSINKELESFKRDAWLELITSQAGSNTRNVLDIGTGPGFFAIILSQFGWLVDGIDCTAEMIKHAANNAAFHGVAAKFSVMDSHCLSYPDESFDLILSRNVTWTLYNPEAAYHEWLRVLRPGGVLLIFDSNWYWHCFDEEALIQKQKAELEAKTRFNLEPFAEPDQELAAALYPNLPLSRHQRPQWDIDKLNQIGYRQIMSNNDINKLIWSEQEQVLYKGTPMFMIKAVK